MAKKLFIRTFGCQMNEYDSDRMADVLHAADGLTLTERAEDADVILVMADGAIVEQGDHQQLMAAHGAYHALYQSQFNAAMVDEDEDAAALVPAAAAH